MEPYRCHIVYVMHWSKLSTVWPEPNTYNYGSLVNSVDQVPATLYRARLYRARRRGWFCQSPYTTLIIGEIENTSNLDDITSISAQTCCSSFNSRLAALVAQDLTNSLWRYRVQVHSLDGNGVPATCQIFALNRAFFAVGAFKSGWHARILIERFHLLESSPIPLLLKSCVLVSLYAANTTDISQEDSLLLAIKNPQVLDFNPYIVGATTNLTVTFKSGPNGFGATYSLFCSGANTTLGETPSCDGTPLGNGALTGNLPAKLGTIQATVTDIPLCIDTDTKCLWQHHTKNIKKSVCVEAVKSPPPACPQSTCTTSCGEGEICVGQGNVWDMLLRILETIQMCLYMTFPHPCQQPIPLRNVDISEDPCQEPSQIKSTIYPIHRCRYAEYADTRV